MSKEQLEREIDGLYDAHIRAIIDVRKKSEATRKAGIAHNDAALEHQKAIDHLRELEKELHAKMNQLTDLIAPETVIHEIDSRPVR